MRGAVVRTLALALARDRGALVMSFVLPAIVFLVFAAILSGATGDDLRIRVALANEAAGPLAARLVEALAHDDSLRLMGRIATDGDRVDQAVAAGGADAGIVIRRDGRALDDLVGDGPAPVLVVTHPARVVAGTIVSGAIQRAYFSAMPDAALKGVVGLVDAAIVELTDQQRAAADAALAEMRTNVARADTPDTGAALTALVETRTSGHSRGTLDQVTYYAAAVAALFVLLSAVHAASSLHDERRSGILDRVVTGPAGVQVLVDGRALFLIAQGAIQTLVIFVVAWVTYARQWPGALWGWLVMTIGLAVATAGLSLLMATLAGSARQAQTASNVLILVASAVGGSMVPRYLMPGWLQTVGWISPNAWVIEGFTRALGPDPQRAASVQPAIVLLIVGLVGWLVARWRVSGWETF